MLPVHVLLCLLPLPLRPNRHDDRLSLLFTLLDFRVNSAVTCVTVLPSICVTQFVVTATWVRYLHPWVLGSNDLDELAAWFEHTMRVLTEEVVDRQWVANQLANVIDIVFLQIDDFEGRPRFHLVTRVGCHIVISLVLATWRIAPSLVPDRKETLVRVVSLNAATGDVDEYFVLSVDFHGVLALQLLCAIASKDVYVAVMKHAGSRMVPAFIEPDSEQ